MSVLEALAEPLVLRALLLVYLVVAVEHCTDPCVVFTNGGPIRLCNRDGTWWQPGQ